MRRRGQHRRTQRWGPTRGMVTVRTCRGDVRLDRDALCEYLPNIAAQVQWWADLSLDMLGYAFDLHSQDAYEIAWYYIFQHIHTTEQEGITTTLIDTLDDWQQDSGVYTAQNLLENPSGLPFVLSAFGDLLSPDVLGCHPDITQNFQLFLEQMLEAHQRHPLRDVYVTAATLSALCAMADDNPMMLQSTAAVIRRVPGAEDVVWWAINDSTCRFYFPIPQELQMALQLRGRSNNAKWPTMQPLMQIANWQQNVPRLMPALPSPPSPVVQPALQPALALPVIPARRPPMHARSRSTPSIRGSSLDPGLLMKVALMHPERLKVDGRLLLGGRRLLGGPLRGQLGI